MKVVHCYPKTVELPVYLKTKLNRLINTGFDHDPDDYRFDMYNYDIIAVLYYNNEPVGSAFLEKHSKDVVEPLSKEFYFITTLTIHPDYRGQKLCNFLMKEIVKKLGKLYSLFLSVDTSPQKANIPGIKCYQKCGFKLVDCLYEKRNDGTFSYMVRVKTPPKKRPPSLTKKKGKTKKGRKDKKDKKGKSMQQNVKISRIEYLLNEYNKNIMDVIQTIQQQRYHPDPYKFFMETEFAVDGANLITFDGYLRLLNEYEGLGGDKEPYSINIEQYFTPLPQDQGKRAGGGGGGGGRVQKPSSILTMR